MPSSDVTSGTDNPPNINANQLAERFFGDTVFSNMIMLGFAWQLGMVPVGEQALMQAVELNGVALEKNRMAIAVGRIAASNPDALRQRLHATDMSLPERESVEECIEKYCNYLVEYQSVRYSTKYRNTITTFGEGLSAVSSTDSEQLVRNAARCLYKLMACKDEYEVARLQTDDSFRAKLDDQFEPGYQVSYHMAPPLLSIAKDWRGRPKKREFGGWLRYPMTGLAKCKRLRGTPIDIFGYTAERRLERSLVGWYQALLDQCMQSVDSDNLSLWLAILATPDDIRGYGIVKEESITVAKNKVEQSLTELHQ